MSVTITIANNNDHTRAAGTMTYTEYDCQRCEFDGANPNCVECAPYGGKGKVRFENLPFEMNVANGNFSLLWNALALPFDWSGSIDARRILAVVPATDTALLMRDTREEGGSAEGGGCRVIHVGIDQERADSYLTRLRAIAEEAAKREERVVWG